jgi:outer membrane lipoprotein SlyB
MGTFSVAEYFLILKRKEQAMRMVIVGLLGLALSSVVADAKGCIKGAVVGGVGGSIVGHGKLGAVAGCIVGRHEANKADAAKTTTDQNMKK